eukprot:Pgem_evm1s1921
MNTKLDIPNTTLSKQSSSCSYTETPEYLNTAPTSAPWQALPVTDEKLDDKISLTITEPEKGQEEIQKASITQVLTSFRENLEI